MRQQAQELGGSKSDALCFSCTAKQIRMVESKTVNIPKPKVKRAQPKKSLGKQPATKASEATAQKTRSALSYGVDSMMDGKTYTLELEYMERENF